MLSITGHLFFLFFLGTVRHSTWRGSDSDLRGVGFDPSVLWSFLMTDGANDHMGHGNGEQLLHTVKHLHLKALKNLIAVS